MANDLFVELQQKLEGKNVRIVLPEAYDERVLEAAVKLGATSYVKPVLVGKKEKVEEIAKGLSLDASNLEVIDHENYEKLEELVAKFVERRAGKVTVRPALQIIKTKPGTKRTSGAFIMSKEDKRYVFADCAINPTLDAEGLAEIAIESAKTAKSFNVDPKVAMLSFSTLGSAVTEDTTKVAEATKLVKENAPELAVEGELQFDAAVVPSVAKLKAPNSKVQGDANVFVFPSLEAGNIGYKIAQRLGGFEAVGPILQGLNAPVNDLSRGCNAEDVYKLSLITAVQALEK